MVKKGDNQMPRITLYCADQAYVGALNHEKHYFQSRMERDKYVKMHDLCSRCENVHFDGIKCNGMVYRRTENTYDHFYTVDEVRDDSRETGIKLNIYRYDEGILAFVFDYGSHVKIVCYNGTECTTFRICNTIDKTAEEIFEMWKEKYEC
jgi:uncharacterized Rmd1/YagE family protein